MNSTPPTTRARWWLALALVLAIWGGKLAVLDRFSSDVPIYDQWPAEGVDLYVKSARGELATSELIRPHNEHRIAFTRVLALGLLAANGQWDARLQCVVNALLDTSLAVVSIFWGWRVLAARWRIGWMLVIVALTAWPAAWENVISGFNSQQYLLLWFSLAAIVLLGGARPWSLSWWIGCACALSALFTMGSGLLAAPAALFASSIRIRTRAELRYHAPTLIACAIVSCVGVLLQWPTLGLSSTRVSSPVEFAWAFFRYLQWPFERLFWFRNFRGLAVLGILLWLPWCCIALGAWRERRRGVSVDVRDAVIFGLGMWVLLQFAGSAYARGAGSPWLAGRYVDTVLVGVAINAACVARLLDRGDALSSRAMRGLIRAGRIGLGAALIGTGVHIVHFFTHELPEHRAWLAEGTATTQRYLATGDVEVVQRGEIPYFNFHKHDFIACLSHSELRAILPPSLQPAGSRVGPLSRAAAALTRAGPMLAVSGVVLLLGLELVGRHRNLVTSPRRSGFSREAERTGSNRG